MALSWVLGAAGCSDDCDNEYDSPEVSSRSCDIYSAPPDDCSGAIPATAQLVIHLSQPLPRIVRVYSGSAYETGSLAAERVPASKDLSIDLPLGTYSATALYVTGTDTVLAVDGDAVDYRSLNTCSKTCYVREPGEVDLKRK